MTVIVNQIININSYIIYVLLYILKFGDLVISYINIKINKVSYLKKIK